MGLGVQGLADAFLMMKMPFESPEAKQLNEDCLMTPDAEVFLETFGQVSPDGLMV